MTDRTVYKFTSKNVAFNAYKSIAAEGLAAVRYQPGELVRAPERLAELGYHLTAFDHLHNALKAAWQHSWTGCIWVARGWNQIHDLPRMLRNARQVSTGRTPIHSKKRWPDGTLMFKGIELKQKVLYVSEGYVVQSYEVNVRYF